MKRLFFLYIALFLISFAAKSNNIKDCELEKKIIKEFTTNVNSWINIQNKFGKVQIIEHNLDKVIFEVTIVTETTDPDKANRIFNSIDVQFSELNNKISAITNLEDQKGRTSFSINYKVYMKNTLKLDIANKFGDVILADYLGKCNIEVKYGTFYANRLKSGSDKPRSQVVLAYSEKSQIKECSWLKLSMSYSDLEIEKADAIILDSKYSKFKIQNCNALVCDSKYDEFDINSVNSLVVVTKYSDLDIVNVFKKFDLDAEYTNIEIEKISSKLESMNILAKYTEAEIGLDPALCFQFEGQQKFGEIKLPSNSNISKTNEGIEEYFKGFVGKEGSNSNIKVLIQFGKVLLKYN